ncbi:ABC transporter ATP-binding protein [Sporosarcina sp. Marseille-Q4063]|uniref:ABC transporter permease n=1 Tax=Sporosarcina sp. Marseille-Q4063 TaxID=2810514 RepID=UPI001BAEFA77|nr:ABC transporter ATP-binding protein [Sporosarcina sp. Marseille-Q4063]QUW20783.1 ABC transporter ATP-binding protein [Sporosarcina sp. Marseille-Q4063]
MSVLKMIFRTELLLLLRNKFIVLPLIINLLGWGYIIISYEIQELHFRERTVAFYSGFIWMTMLNLLIIGLLAVYMAGKDRENEFEYLVATYQVKNVEWIMGKWLVTQLYGLSITLITLLIQAGWLAIGKMAVGDLAINVFYLFVQIEGAFFLLISLGFLFGILMKNMFAYLAIPAILVLSLGLPFDYTGVALTYDNPRFHLLTPFDYMFIESPYEGIWGIDRVLGSTILHQVIVLFLGIILILVTLLLFRSNRRGQKEKRIVPILISILVIPTLLLGGIRYGQYNQALEHFITTGQQYTKEFEGEEEDYWIWENSYYDAYLDHTKYEFSMERTDLAVQLQPDNQINVTSNLTIKHNGDKATNEVYLTLYHELEVSNCSSESAEATCSREGDLVTVRFEELIEPGDAFELSLNYHGSILQYREDGYVEHSFIQNNRVYLPKEAGWYPLIGERQLVIAYEHDKRFVKFEQRNGRLVEDFPTEFTVEIINENNEIPLALSIPKAGAGLYHGTTQYGLSLVGGNIKETTVDQIRVVGHPEVLKSVGETIGEYQKTWNFIEEWLEVSMTPEVIYILNDEHSYLTRHTPSQEFLVWGNGYLGDTRESTIAYSAIHYLVDFTLDRSTDLHLLNELVEWSIFSAFQDEGSFKKWYSPMVTPMEETELVEVLANYEEQGKLSEVIKFIYHQYAQLEDKSEFDIEKALQLYERDSIL